MMETVKIARATKNDADGVLKISKTAFLQYQNELHSNYKLPALFETKEEVELDIEKNSVLIAKENGEIIGSIRYKKLTEKLAYVYRFAVDPEEQNGGVGTALIEFVIEECEKKGFSVVALHTNTKYFTLARYYYGKQFFVHSTTCDRGYIRA